ncbi:MAG: type II toxin-antitoxin system VapC family toxin [Nitrosomonadales bacterium]|nr:type II toxin-antitoxin system VapC family toxin [Nitrosomonadales bacterium]
MKRKVYIETSLISYLTARPARTIIGAAQQQITQDWWEKERGNYDLLISELVIRECAAGDPEAARRRLDAIHNLPLLDIDDHVRTIATDLVVEGCVPQNVAEDAMHIAIAAVHGVDFILTWNFKHIANPMLQERIAQFLETRNYLIPFICSPQELLGEDDGTIDG